MATNLLQQMFVVIPTGKEATFKSLHVGKGSTDAYYNKIAFLEATGEIVTKGVVYALNANLLNADKNTEGSIKYQINQVVTTYLSGNNTTEAIDTLQEVIDWISAHKGVDGGAGEYLVTDVQTLIEKVGDEGTKATEAKDATITEGVTLYDAEGNEVSADKIVAGTTYYTDAEHTTTAVKGTDYTEPVAATSATDATGLYKYVDDAVEAANSSADDAIKALDVASNKVDGTNVHVTYKEEDGIVTVEKVEEDYATVTRTAADKIGEEGATAAKIEVKSGDEDKLVKASDLKNAVDYSEDRLQEMIATLDADIKSDEGSSVTVEVKEVDGKVTDVIITEDFAGVTYTATADAVLYTEEDEAADATHVAGTVKTAAVKADLTVDADDEDKALKASAVADIKSYVDDVVSVAEKARQAAIDAMDVASNTVKNTQNSVDYTAVTYKEENGIVTIESVTNAIGSVEESDDNEMVVKTHGLIDAQALADTLNAIDPWFEYDDSETTTTAAPAV